MIHWKLIIKRIYLLEWKIKNLQLIYIFLLFKCLKYYFFMVNNKINNL